jgi:heme-degrading monooxygenase HmoA
MTRVHLFRRSPALRLTFGTALLALAALAGCEYVSADGWIYSPFEGPGFSMQDGLTVDLPGEHQYIVATTYLPIQQTPEATELFSGHMQALQAELDAGPDGLIGYSLATTVLGDEVRTLSVWRDADALFAFTLGPAHSAAIDDAAAIEQPGTAKVFNWTATADELPPRWDDARERIETDGRHVY